MDIGICIGDLVTFTNLENGGCLSAAPDSGTKSAVSCSFSHGEESRLEDAADPLGVVNRNVLLFEVCATNKYKAAKKLKELQLKGASNTELRQAEVEADYEIKENEKSSKSQLGRKVYYGQIIQLRSVSTQKYIACGKQQQFSGGSTDQKTINLSDGNGRSVQFKFVLKTSNDESGALVKPGDVVNIEAVKDNGQFVHVASETPAVSMGIGVELSLTGTDFRINRVCQPTISVNGIHTGEIIQISQKRLNAVLVSEGQANSNGFVFLQQSSNSDKSQNKDKIESFDSFWQIDIVKAGDGMLHGDNLCRLFHISSQKFLCLENEKFALSSDKTDRRTLFKLQSSTGKTKFLQDNCSVQMKNVGAKSWLGSSKETQWKNRITMEKESVFLGSTIQQDKVQCHMTQLTKQKGGADLFQITKVDSTTRKLVCIVQELTTRATIFLQKNQNDSVGNMHNLVNNIEEVSNLLTTDTSGAYHQIKSFVCESGLLKYLFKLMGYLPTGQRFNERLYTSAADLIVTCLKGSSPENKLFGVQFLDFCFQETHNKQGAIKQKPLSILVEIFEDNKLLINKMNDSHIDKIFDLYQSDKNYMYFKLLGSLCVCHGKPIVKNQIYIANKLIAGDENQELCYLCYMGEQIGMKDNTVYISTSITQPWVELQDVYKNEGLYLQYHHQLEFFRVLCQGGNIQTVRRLTTELGFITFDHLKYSVMDENVSPDHRAIYCQLLTVMCIEANREPLYGKISLAYDLDNLQESQFQVTPDGEINPLITWVCDVISKNDVLIASQDEQNIFLSSVLDMAYSLILYGYMGSCSTSNMGEKVEHCFKGIIKLLDGTTDIQSKAQITAMEMKTFKDHGRFQENLSSSGIFKAKMSALKVVDLFLEKVKSESLLEFVKFFKGQTVHLHEDYSKYKTLVRTLPKVSLRLIDEDLLLDLAQYEYKHLVQKALDTLNKMFSVTEYMLDKAKVVQVLTTQSSRASFKKIKDAVSKLKEALRSGDPLQYKESSQMCGTLTDLCTESDGSPSLFNQMLIFNTGLLDSVFQSLITNNTYNDDIVVLVKSLSRGNSAVQEYLFGQLDVLLNIPNISTVIVQTVMEIFKGNQEVCLKINQHQMTCIFKLLARLKQPELIMLLHVIVRPSPGRVLKRNKRMVVSYFPAYRNEMSLDGTSSKMDGLETTNNSNISEYKLAILDFFATCAEGDVRFQQSFCSHMSSNEILKVLTTSDHLAAKLSYLRFLTCVYVTKEKEQLLQNEAIWSLITSFNHTIQLVKESAAKDHGFIHRHSSFIRLGRNTLQNEESMVLYFTEGILPLLKTLFTGKGLTITQQYQPELDSLDQALQVFVTDLAPDLFVPSHVQQLLKDTIVAVHSHSTNTDNIETVLNILEVKVKTDVDSFTANQSEDEVNKRFQVFSQNMYNVYQYGTLDISHVKDAATWLPDSENFKSLVRCFILERAKTDQEKYQPLSTICKYLIYSSKQDKRSTRAGLDLRCFQILRSVLHDEIKHIPQQFHHSVNKYQSRLNKIERIQNVLVSLGCVECVFCQLQDEGQDGQTSQALAFLSELLFNRNESVQVSILNFTTTLSSEYLFKTLHLILQQGIEDFKDRKLQWEPRSNQVSSTLQNNNTQTRYGQKRGLHSGRVSPKIEETGQMDVGGDVGNSDRLKMAIRIIGDFGGSSEEIKDLLRKQGTNSQLYNLVGDCTVLMTVLCLQLDQVTVTMYKDIIRTLTSLVSGNAENQSTVMDHNGLDAVNHILLTWEFSNVSMNEIQELKQLNIMLARTMIEMNYGSHLNSKHAELPKLIAEQISTQTLTKEVAVTWNSSKKTRTKSSYSEVFVQTKDGKEKSMMQELCCQYSLLLSRKLDLIPSEQGEIMSEDVASQKMFTTLEKKKKSIELSKDGVLQKHHFTLDGMVKPDRATRQIIHEETDRSSNQSKLHDLVKWSSEYTRQMAPRKTIASNPFGKIFIQAWVPLNVMLFLLTLFLVIYISIAFTAPTANSVEFHHPDYKLRNGAVFIYVVGGVHNFISTAIFLHFIIVESPTVPALSHIASLPTQKSTKVLPSKMGVNWSYKFYQYQLVMNAFGLKTMYYTVFLGCSVAGTILDGYFFAFHLFHLLIVSSHLQKLCRVILNGWKYLALLAMVTVAIVFVYSIIIFLSFRDYWSDTSSVYTSNIFKCFISLLQHGLIERNSHLDDGFGKEVRYAAFDLGFFLMVTILCLYLALGIIIDSFAEIRTKQERARQNDATVCFICNLKISDFDQTTQGFRHHIKKEHNIWDYMAFLQYLDQTSPNTLTGLELFVLQKLQKKELDFFPYQKSATLDGLKMSDADISVKMHQIEMRMAEMDARISREPDLHVQGSNEESEDEVPALRIDRRTDKRKGIMK